MKLRLFAAIDVGSFELTCKIFQYSAKNGMKEVDFLRHRMDLEVRALQRESSVKRR